VPEIDLASYCLPIIGLVKKPLCLSLDDLRQFPKVTLMATLQCAGNRRKDLLAIEPIPHETPWDAEAIGNAWWSGVSLREVLLAAGIEPEARHVAFSGCDEVEIEDRQFNYGSSIPLKKALSPEILLAYEMNDKPLTPVHGFPLRVIVPGYVGARSVKWLCSIQLQATPSANYYQTHAYKLFPSHIRTGTADWSQGLMLGDLPINAVICQPVEGQVIPAGSVWVQGYTITGGGRSIERVDLSIDGGETWLPANLSEKRYPWAWRFWQARLEFKTGSYQLVVRAWDSAGNTQPDDARKIWNFKGYLNNAWHRVNITACPID
jgi:sulfite oxidase